jgi:hypothetical protein
MLRPGICCDERCFDRDDAASEGKADYYCVDVSG